MNYKENKKISCFSPYQTFCWLLLQLLQMLMIHFHKNRWMKCLQHLLQEYLKRGGEWIEREKRWVSFILFFFFTLLVSQVNEIKYIYLKSITFSYPISNPTWSWKSLCCSTWIFRYSCVSVNGIDLSKSSRSLNFCSNKRKVCACSFGSAQK